MREWRVTDQIEVRDSVNLKKRTELQSARPQVTRPVLSEGGVRSGPAKGLISNINIRALS